MRANEEFAKWLQGEKSMPFGEDNHHVPVGLIDFENLENNSFVITNRLDPSEETRYLMWYY